MLLWPFNKYPGTDYETFNWEWILKTVKEWVAKMQSFKDVITGEWNDMQDDWQDFIDSTYKEQITEILEDHPEWVTTVMDGTITYNKLADSLHVFVTPEMFGAIGNGVADDTDAWQAAVNVGLPVIAKNTIYKVGQINVSKNIIIDCSDAEFIATDETVFMAAGEVTNIINNPGNYIANSQFQLPNGYTGMAMLKSDENIISNRTYYNGGFITKFENGLCVDGAPVSFRVDTIETINPITCIIKNIKNVRHINNQNINHTVIIKYGYKCIVENINQDGDAYNIITYDQSLNCIINNVTGNVGYDGTSTSYYLIELDSSSKIITYNCDLTSDWWHCWTTGGSYLCMNNICKRCSFKIGTGGSAAEDHDNAIGTVFEDCECDGLVLFGNSTARRVTICTHKHRKNLDYVSGTLSFYTTNLDGCNNFTAENITFITDPENMPTTNSRYGIIIGTTAQTQGNTFYINDVKIKDITSNIDTIQLSCVYLTPTSETTAHLICKGTWLFNNVIGRFRDVGTVEDVNWDQCDVIIKNCVRRSIEGYRFAQANTDVRNMRSVIIHDSVIGTTSGVFKYLILQNVKSFTPGNALGTLSGDTLEACNIDRITLANIRNFTKVNVTDMKWNDNTNYTSYPYVFKNASIGVYGQITENGIVNNTL